MTIRALFPPDYGAKPVATQFAVVWVKSTGKRVDLGMCPTREAAESWEALLNKYVRPDGARAHVEERAA
jgi:hypothetical protein